jgi:hypothetical protein
MTAHVSKPKEALMPTTSNRASFMGENLSGV